MPQYRHTHQRRPGGKAKRERERERGEEWQGEARRGEAELVCALLLTSRLCWRILLAHKRNTQHATGRRLAARLDTEWAAAAEARAKGGERGAKGERRRGG